MAVLIVVAAKSKDDNYGNKGGNIDVCHVEDGSASFGGVFYAFATAAADDDDDVDHDDRDDDDRVDEDDGDGVKGNDYERSGMARRECKGNTAVVKGNYFQWLFSGKISYL